MVETLSRRLSACGSAATSLPTINGIGTSARHTIAQVVPEALSLARAHKRCAASLLPILLLSCTVPLTFARVPSVEAPTEPYDPEAETIEEFFFGDDTEPVIQPALPATHAVAMFLTASSAADEGFLSYTIDDTMEAGGNALIFDVKGSAVFFDANTPLARKLGLVRETYNLQEILAVARAHDIFTIGRVVAIKDAGLSRVRPDTIITHPRTGGRIGYEFVDPDDETVLQYNREVICALAKAGIDEINLDYIRFSSKEAGWLAAYSAVEKSQKIGSFIRMAREAIDECGPETALGISTFAILGWDYEPNVATLGQDIISFAPLVDIISPMAYPISFSANAYYTPGTHRGSRSYYLVWRTLEGYKALLGPEHAHKLRPWLQGFGITQKSLADQMKGVSDAGLCGFMIWNADNAYGLAYKALRGWQRPEACNVPREE